MKKSNLAVVAVGALGLATGAYGDGSITVDVTGIGSWGSQGDPLNTVLIFDTNRPNARLASVEWFDISIIDPSPGADVSWLSDVVIYFGSSSNSRLDDLNDNGDDLGLPDNDNGGAPFGVPDGMKAIAGNLDADGLLYLEFAERLGFDESPGAFDNFWNTGSLIITWDIPTPGALALLGIAGLASVRRRRR